MVSVSEPTALTADLIRAVPKVLLHDHLDGGLRPATVVELARVAGHTLPVDDAESLGRWFTEAADSGSLERYLETFDHTVAVMQRADHLTRVAASAWRTSSPTAWCTPRCATPPSSTSRVV
jgi:adenosine deaminase